MTTVEDYAKTLDTAARTATAIPQFAADEFDVDTAYRIQAESIQLRIVRGETQTGVKMGFTSKAKMQQMGVDELIWGRLTDQMQIAEGGDADSSRFIHPRVEPEIAFVLGKELSGNVTLPEAISAVDAIAPALEIIDSRYTDFKFSLPDVVADNASSSGYVIGQYQPASTSIDNLGIVMSINDQPCQIGSTAAILGHPLRSLVHAARLAEIAGQALLPGWIILAGAASAAVAISAGNYVKSEFQNLGRVEFHLN